ncbi:hypothetical protein TRVL_01016 [Trypanosoma vivax]|nr:hypothetical protein TRVL_01016 [Trypanosoma vivax]
MVADILLVYIARYDPGDLTRIYLLPFCRSFFSICFGTFALFDSGGSCLIGEGTCVGVPMGACVEQRQHPRCPLFFTSQRYAALFCITATRKTLTDAEASETHGALCLCAAL